jgi:hypothetical protein
MIIVGVVEACRIPRDLRAMPMLDLRGDFDATITALVALLQNPAPTRPVAAWRTRLPPGVNRMAQALLMRDLQRVLGALVLALLALSVLLFGSLCRLVTDGLAPFLNDLTVDVRTSSPIVLDFSPYLPGVVVIACALVLINLVRVMGDLELLPFLARKTDDVYLKALPDLQPGWVVLLWLALAVAFFDPIRSALASLGVPLADPLLLFFTGAGVLLMALLPFVSKRLAPRHPNADIVRYATLGKVPTQWRAAVNGAVASANGAPTRAAQGSLTMHLYAEPGDEEVVKAIQPLVEQMGGQFVAPDAPARYDLLILSHKSRLERVRAALGGTEGVLGILASRCTIPDELQQLRNFQLVDFSRRDPDSLIAALGLLTAASDADRMTMQAYRDPVSLNRVAPPAIIKTLSHHLLTLALLSLVVIALFWLSGVTGSLLLIDQVALGGCALLLLAAGVVALRGRALLPRPLLLALAFAPLIIIAISSIALPAQGVVFGTSIPLNPQGALILIGAAALLTVPCVMEFMRNPHTLIGYGQKIFGMPGLRINPLPVLGWVAGALALAAMVVNS